MFQEWMVLSKNTSIFILENQFKLFIPALHCFRAAGRVHYCCSGKKCHSKIFQKSAAILKPLISYEWPQHEPSEHWHTFSTLSPPSRIRKKHIIHQNFPVIGKRSGQAVRNLNLWPVNPFSVSFACLSICF